MHILFTLPHIRDKLSICTTENLTPLQYKISKTCYSGPITRQELTLITCTNTKTILPADTLVKCYSADNTFLCPENVLTFARDVAWLGVPWSPQTHMDFSRTHRTTKCRRKTALLHLGGHYYLSTKRQTFQLTNRTLTLQPLAIYQLPCGEAALAGLATGLGPCPSSLQIHLPIFNNDAVRYIPYNADIDEDLLALHYQSLKIPLPLKFNKSTIKSLDATYDTIDSRMSTTLSKLRSDINKIHETSDTTTIQIFVYVIGTLTVLNSITLLGVVLYLTRRLPKQQQMSLQTTKCIELHDSCVECQAPLADDPTEPPAEV